MGTNSRSEQPFKRLGSLLKMHREKGQESLAEVCGAIEVDEDILKKFEDGEQRPSEELLLLFINHFSIPEEEAAKLWELANYDDTDQSAKGLAAELGRQLAVVMPMDVRVVYTDLVHVMANDYGIVMNFMQTAGPSNQPLAVARVGMSREHAKSIVELLTKTLEQTYTDKSTKLLKDPSDSDATKRSTS